VSWRFGLEVCRFLRATSTGCGNHGPPLFPPLEFPKSYTADELNRIPDGLWYHVSPARGGLEARAQQVGTPMTLSGTYAARVGASLTMFANLAHEALFFFSRME
jgi:predicted small lipoprotein YifL